MAMSVRLDDELAERVERAAQKQGVSKSEFVRRCVEQQLSQEEPKPSAYELGKHLFGKYSGPVDLAERSEEIFREKIHAKNRRA